MNRAAILALIVVLLGAMPLGFAQSDTPLKGTFSSRGAKFQIGGGVAFTGTVCNASSPETVYYARAEPVTLNGSGTRSFATDVRGTIFQNGTATAPADPIASTETPVQ